MVFLSLVAVRSAGSVESCTTYQILESCISTCGFFSSEGNLRWSFYNWSQSGVPAQSSPARMNLFFKHQGLFVALVLIFFKGWYLTLVLQVVQT